MKWRIARVAKTGLLVLLLTPSVAVGGTYYVRTDGNNGSTGSSNSAAGAWRTIDYAADRVVAGDTVRVQPGTYAERLSPGVSGTAGNPITFVADGMVTLCGIDLSNRNYLRFIGFTVDTDAGCPRVNRAIDASGTTTGIEFWNNTVRDANAAGIGSGSYGDRHQNWIVLGNLFTAIGGNGICGTAVALRGNNNIIAYNEIAGVDCDAFMVDGSHNRWLNNYIHTVLDTYDLHSDIFQSNSSSLGLSYNLFESNFEVGNGRLPNEHGVLLQNQSTVSCSTGVCGPVTENLFRRNVWHNTSGGAIGVDQAIIAGITNTRLVHETLVSPMRTAPTAPYGSVFNGSGITARVFNSIHYQAWGDNVSANVQPFYAAAGAQILGADYNLAYSPYSTPTFTSAWTGQAHARTNVDPGFVDAANDIFQLGPGSGARGTGGPLTTTAGSGTGLTFQVAPGGGGFFRGTNASVTQYGGRLAPGDTITVGATTRTISSVSGDTITVTQAFSWNAGEPVYLGPSSTPDIGAYPFRALGYDLTASYSVSNGIATVTPGDPSLVRYVICYQDGIPTGVSHSSPYTCSVGSGALEVRIYPLFPSKVMFTRAPAAPSSVIIRD